MAKEGQLLAQLVGAPLALVSGQLEGVAVAAWVQLAPLGSNWAEEEQLLRLLLLEVEQLLLLLLLVDSLLD